MIIKRCSSKGAFEAIPEKPIKLDLDRIKYKYEVLADLPILIIIKYKDFEVTCFKNGKLMIKNCNSKEKAEDILSEIMEEAK